MKDTILLPSTFKVQPIEIQPIKMSEYMDQEADESEEETPITKEEEVDIPRRKGYDERFDVEHEESDDSDLDDFIVEKEVNLKEKDVLVETIKEETVGDMMLITSIYASGKRIVEHRNKSGSKILKRKKKNNLVQSLVKQIVQEKQRTIQEIKCDMEKFKVKVEKAKTEREKVLELCQEITLEDIDFE
jgi:hypothetical protein